MKLSGERVIESRKSGDEGRIPCRLGEIQLLFGHIPAMCQDDAVNKRKRKS
jgi:hypothetical protein